MVKVGQRYIMLNYNNDIMEVIAVHGDYYDCKLYRTNGLGTRTVKQVPYNKGEWINSECRLDKEYVVKRLLEKVDMSAESSLS